MLIPETYLPTLWALAAAGALVLFQLIVADVAAIRALVRQGAGWSVLPRDGLTAEEHAGVVRPLGDPPMRVRLMLAFSANRPVTPALRALTSFLKNEVALLQARQVLSPPLPHR